VGNAISGEFPLLIGLGTAAIFFAAGSQLVEIAHRAVSNALLIKPTAFTSRTRSKVALLRRRNSESRL
jgi:hypothetical protein